MLSRSPSRGLILLTAIVFFSVTPALSQGNNSDQPLSPIIDVQPSSRDKPTEFDRFIDIRFENLSQYRRNGAIDIDGFTLYLNNHPMPSVDISPQHANTLRFKLKSDNIGLSDPEREALRQAWREILDSPRSIMPLAVGLSYRGDPLPYADEAAKSGGRIYFRVYEDWILVTGMILLGAIVAALIYLARKSDIIRDSGSRNPSLGQRKPYSLARTQMAVWTVLVLGSFGFIYLITDNHDIVTEQSLVLLGIAAATALGAVAIDATKNSTVTAELDRLLPERARIEAELQETTNQIAELRTNIDATNLLAQGQGLTTAQQQLLEQQKENLRQSTVNRQQKEELLSRLNEQLKLQQSQLIEPISQGFMRDILTDRDGITLHRFQIALWTVALAVFFVWEVWDQLAMPAFSTELLALMGISSGTYLGFKWPERQAS